MRVLIVHNRYRSGVPSGENTAVSREADLLRDHGLDVEMYSPSSDDIAGAAAHVRAALGPLHAAGSLAELARAIERMRPHVVHLHNVYPLISPSAVRVAKRAGAAVVQTVHNYRHGCVNGLHYRNGGTCIECLGSRLSLPAVRHGCYRDSRVQSLPMVASQVLHRGTWDLVDTFLALTPFMARWLRGLGFADDQIVIRPSWVADPGPPSDPGRSLLFMGRLDDAKGVELLLSSLRYARKGRQVIVAGSGPLQSKVEEVARIDPRISFVGRLDPVGVSRALKDCSGLLQPSVCFEGFPLTVVEAFAHGRPVVALRGTSTASVVDPAVGWSVDPNPAELARVVDGWDEQVAAQRGRSARERYLTCYTPDAAVRSLVAAYEGAVFRSSGTR